MTRISISGKPQMTLGELLDAFEQLKPSHTWSSGETDDRVVYFDFVRVFPARLISWRGSYAELAITYAVRERGFSPPTVEAFLSTLRDATAPGRSFGGWKGGDYEMTRETPVWVDDLGESHRTAVVGVHTSGEFDHECDVIIDTAWCDF